MTGVREINETRCNHTEPTFKKQPAEKARFMFFSETISGLLFYPWSVTSRGNLSAIRRIKI
jgi:hypothetical protein